MVLHIFLASAEDILKVNYGKILYDYTYLAKVCMAKHQLVAFFSLSEMRSKLFDSFTPNFSFSYLKTDFSQSLNTISIHCVTSFSTFTSLRTKEVLV